MKEKDVLLVGALVAGAVVLVKVVPNLFVSGYTSFAAAAFFQPEKVADLAAGFSTESEDAFVLDAWQWVGANIPYEPIGSDIEFDGAVIRCLDCYTVEQILARGKGNCVSKSALLASILLNRIAPGRIHMVIGGFSLDGVGGHAWCELDREGAWHLLEATSPPPKQPWTPAESVSMVYIPYAVFNPVSFQCLDNRICIRVGHCDCGRRIQELL